MFIGNKEIDRFDELSTNQKEIFFKDGSRMILSNELYNMVITEEIQNTEPRDIITDRVCRKVFVELSDLGLDMMLAQKVLNGLRNLIDNIWQEGVAKKFEEKTTDDIKLKDLLFS